jgi:hypothetical protein
MNDTNLTRINLDVPKEVFLRIVRYHRYHSNSLDRQPIPEKEKQSPAPAIEPMHGDKIENRQQSFSFPQKESKKMDITCDVIHFSLAEDRFDHVIYPPPKTPAWATGYRYLGMDALRKRSAYIREKPLDAEVCPLWSSLIECHLHPVTHCYHSAAVPNRHRHLSQRH